MGGRLRSEQAAGFLRITRPTSAECAVSIHDIDIVAVPAMQTDNENVTIVIDEIGKMECYSSLLKETVLRVLDSKNPVLGSIAMSGGPFIKRIKRRDDILLIEVTKENRNSLVERFI